MKKITTILLILTLSFVYGQNSQVTKPNDKEVIELTESVNQLQRQVQELKTKQEWKNEILGERLKQASDTISYQNSLLNSFGVLYSIITAVIAIIGIALPILTYQFGIKPSQQALKEFENNAEKKMEEFLSKTRNNQIEQALKNLKSQNQELKTNALTFLSLTYHQGFTDQQIYKLCMFLKSEDIDPATKNMIAFVISHRKSDYVTEYFSEGIKKDPNDLSIKCWAARYFLNIGIKDHLEVFRNLILTVADRGNELQSILIHISITINKDAVKLLINDNELIDKLDGKALKLLKNLLLNQDQQRHLKLSENDFEQSYLIKKINETGILSTT